MVSNIQMKKATYTLILEFENGDAIRYGGLTQTQCYEKLNQREEWGWHDIPSDLYIKRWKIETQWQDLQPAFPELLS